MTYGNGMFQKDLYDLLLLINTNFTGILAQIDADNTGGGSGSTDYEATYAITFPTNIQAQGIESQGAVLDYLKDFITQWNLALAHMDDDARIQTVTYESGCAITDVIESLTAGNLYSNGVNQGNLVKLLDTIITKIAACTALLKADGGLTDTTYDNWDVPDTVDATYCTD